MVRSPIRTRSTWIASRSGATLIEDGINAIGVRSGALSDSAALGPSAGALSPVEARVLVGETAAAERTGVGSGDPNARRAGPCAAATRLCTVGIGCTALAVIDGAG